MAGEKELREGYQALEKEMALLESATKGKESIGEYTAAYAEFVTTAYNILWSNCAEDSPYLELAKKVAESELDYRNRARAIFGVLKALLKDIDETGYFSAIDESEHYRSYDKFSTTLRNWLIAYGVGGPALLLAEKSILPRIIDTGKAPLLGVLFLGGVLLQVIKSAVYKATSWYAIDYNYVPEKKASWKMKSALWINNNMGIDLLFDLATIGMFIAATILVFVIIGSATQTIA